MIDASLVELVGFDDMSDDCCQISGIGRSTHLVEYHLQGVVTSREVLHRLHEILTPLRVEPCCANDDVLAACSLDALFSGELGLAIYAERIGFPVFLARNVLVALEHIVCAHMNQGSIHFLHRLSQVACCRIVEQVGEVEIALRLIHIGIGSTVNNNLDIIFLHLFADSVEVSNIQFLIAFSHIGEDKFVIAVFGANLHFMAELTISACN